ncbi:MAG TPA: diguanylate cyclase [Planktothrix sp.]|jgi:diguanylate cyclase (GGDEF)-like protein
MTEEKVDPRTYDPSMAEQGWAVLGKESAFTRMVFQNRWNRQRFKETRQQQVFEKSRQLFLTDEKIEEYEQAAVLDKATGLYNSRSFKKKLHYELKRAKRYKRPLSLLILSIDRMDEIRRQYGLLAQDEVMKAAADIVKGAIRDVDIACRSNADQLAVIFPETYSSRAIVVSDRVREKLKSSPVSADLRGLAVTASIGVVSYPTHARDGVDLLNMALDFLVVARKQGGDQIYSG